MAVAENIQDILRYLTGKFYGKTKIKSDESAAILSRAALSFNKLESQSLQLCRVHLVMSGTGSSAISTIHYFSLQSHRGWP